MIRLPLFSVLFFSLFSFQVFAANLLNGETVREMEWEQLMPADFSLEDLFGQQDQLASIDDFDPKAQLLLDEMMAAMESAPVVPELDGAMVKLPGYVVPMESDGMNVTAFFWCRILAPVFMCPRRLQIRSSTSASSPARKSRTCMMQSG